MSDFQERKSTQVISNVVRGQGERGKVKEDVKNENKSLVQGYIRMPSVFFAYKPTNILCEGPHST